MAGASPDIKDYTNESDEKTLAEMFDVIVLNIHKHVEFPGDQKRTRESIWRIGIIQKDES